MTDLSEPRQQRIREALDHHRSFKFCGPSDDLDEITAVTLGYRHLVVQLQRLASPILPEPAASLLNSLEVEVDNLYSAFEARAEIEAIRAACKTLIDSERRKNTQASNDVGARQLVRF